METVGVSLSTTCAQVDEEQVLAAHAALVRSGTNAWQPLNFCTAGLMEGMDGMGSAGGDSEVQQALEQLLIANRYVSRSPCPASWTVDS